MRDWEREYADPTVAQVEREPAAARSDRADRRGQGAVRQFRASVERLQARLGPARADAREALRPTTPHVVWFWVIVTSVVVLISVALVALRLRRQVVLPLQRSPRVCARSRAATSSARWSAGGAVEVVELAEDVESMRARIVAELAALREAESDLRRSNTELEQFAYVASHDLQEPLRKVASFCQLLQQRYGGQLDARADQYIGFAVDGAQRMQDLINDLLAFSRVGRVEQPHIDVDCDALVARVRADLGRAIEESDAEIDASGTLPTVRGRRGRCCGSCSRT